MGDEDTYYIVMENLFLGFDLADGLQVFDLKGSETRRYVDPDKPNQVLLDTNFRIIRNSEPLSLSSSDYKTLIDHALSRDAELLARQNVMDYSLLVIINRKLSQVKIGIIDYLRQYTWDKQMETVGKKMTAGGIPTIINPQEYRERFIAAMKRYLIPIFPLN
eukprot:TRINITY_DN2588_c0_g2_i1.p1 TRINITY_DN2588_c0_g2~~TRINITY_DN2588_c0_g2_i1.p1  ORF type:complete len:162 (+),score=39.91 TRINITY_DN2588_c0_g2_i1:39-524(+)